MYRSPALIQGASRGIGLEFTKQLLHKQVPHVFATCRDPSAAVSLQQLAQQHRDQLTLLPLDLADEETIETAKETVDKKTNQLGLLLNCSGILHEGTHMPEKKVEEITPEWVAKNFTVNTIGPMLMAKWFAPFLLRQQQPSIFASISARVGSISDNRIGGWYSYRTSKAAQNMFTKTLAIEFARRNKSSVCVGLHPGTVDTGLSKPFQKHVANNKLFSTAYSVEQLLRVLEGLSPEATGKFYAYDGSEIPWQSRVIVWGTYNVPSPTATEHRSYLQCIL